MKLKRIFTAALAAMLLLGLAACSSGGNGDVLHDDGWSFYNEKGSYSLAVNTGMTGEAAPRLLREQPAGEWMLMTAINSNTAWPGEENHAGLVLYTDKDNYLIWGPSAGGEVTLSGKLKGKDTGSLMTLPAELYALRIWKVTRDSAAPRYYFYATRDTYYSWQYAGFYEDTDGIFESTQYGVMGEAGEEAMPYCTQFEYIDEFCVYNYKDYFRSAALDGRWVDVKGNAENKNNRLHMQADSHILRNPLPYDWTIETQPAQGDAGLKVEKDGAVLTLTADGTQVKAVMSANGQTQILAQEAMGAEPFLRIIKRDNTYILRISDDGKTFRELTRFVDEIGSLTGARYGITAGADAQLRYFWEGPSGDGTILSVEWFEEKGQITGEESLNKTQSQWGLGSTDLGTMFELNGAVYMVFGDTFQYSNQVGNWYKNSMAKITDTENFQNGPVFEWVRVNQNNGGLVNVRPNTDTGSMIATSGIGDIRDGKPTLFMHIMEIRRWTSNGTHWVVNGSGWASSTNDGASWTLHDRIFEGETNFAQIACHKGDDGYLYILGAGPAGYGPVKLCRTPMATLEKKEGYEFFIGTDASGAPQWSKNEEDAVVVIDSVNKEIAMSYNPGLECFLFTTIDNVTQQMVIRDAKNLWGPWSKPQVLFDESYVTHADIGQRFFYGSFMYPGFMEDGGKTVYMTLNKWVPYNIQWMKVHFETAK